MDSKAVIQALFNPRTVAALMNPTATAEQKMKVLAEAIGADYTVLQDQRTAELAIAELFTASQKPGAGVLFVAGRPERWGKKKIQLVAVLTES